MDETDLNILASGDPDQTKAVFDKATAELTTARTQVSVIYPLAS